METLELLERIANGEDSFTQFKREAIKSKELAKEFVAFSNAEGGIIIFGIVDKTGEIVGLTKNEVEEIGQLIGNTANENVKPPIHPLMQNISIDDKRLIVVTIKNGVNKPYATSSGEYYIKSGSDKKKISHEELRRLFAESKRLFADEEVIEDSSIIDFNTELFYKFLQKDNLNILENLQSGKLNLQTILNNYNLMKEDKLTLAGNLLFGINIKKYTPSFYIDCCHFRGDDISSNS